MIYGMRPTRTSVLQLQGAGGRSLPHDVFGAAVHLQICVPVEHTDHVCSEMVADSRTIVVGAAQGVLHAFTWHGKVQPLCVLTSQHTSHHPPQLRGTVSPLPPTVVLPAPSAPAALAGPLGSRAPSVPGPRNRTPAQSTPLPVGEVGTDGVASMDYAAAARHVAILLRDGRLGLCRCVSPENYTHNPDDAVHLS